MVGTWRRMKVMRRKEGAKISTYKEALKEKDDVLPKQRKEVQFRGEQMTNLIREEEVKVEERARCILCPPSLCPLRTIYLAPIDIFWKDFHYNRRVLFYSVNSNHYSSLVDILKASLLQALPLFYPWLGRLSLSNDAHIDTIHDSIDDDHADGDEVVHDAIDDNDNVPHHIDGAVHDHITHTHGGNNHGANIAAVDDVQDDITYAHGNANSNANTANSVHSKVKLKPNAEIKVKPDAKVNPKGRLVIDFDKKKELGVEFIEAYVDLPYSELLKDGFQLRPFFDKLCKYSYHETSKIYDLPLLSIQVTKFKDGGMALAYAQSHVVADGHSMWHFMKAWSECARGLEISMPPLHQREFFKIDKPSKELAHVFIDDLLSNTDDEVDGSNLSGKGNPAPSMVLTPRLFQFTKEMILCLKEMASQGGRYGPFTSYEVLVSHFWRHVTKARALKSGCYVHMMVLANCRKRVTPPLPPSYFGNCVNSGVAQTTAGEILREDFAMTVLRIHNAITQAASESSLLGFNHWLELKNENLVFGMKWPNSEGMIVASSHFFPCYEIDFGLTGCPDAVRTTLVKGDGEMVLFPGKNGNGSIDVCMPLQPCVMDRLLQDPHFLNF